MTVARSVADVLSEHVEFEVECIDRMYLNVWVPRLAYGGGVAGFFVGHRGHVYASTALMDPMAKAFVRDIHGFIDARGLDLVSFGKGQRKDEVTQQRLAGFTGPEGVLYVGRAQEKCGVWRTQRRHNPVTGASYAWLVRSTAFINYFYFYCVDADFGPFFIKFSTFFPFAAKLCLLTELPAESPGGAGQTRVRVVTVPAHGLHRRTVPGSAGVGGAPARGAGGQRGSVRAVPAA